MTSILAVILVTSTFAPALADSKKTIELSVLGTYETGLFDGSAAEIAAFDKKSEKLFVTNADANTLDVLDISDPTNPSLVNTINLVPYGDGVNSVAAKKGLVAVAVEADPKQDPGKVVFFDSDGNYLHDVTVGALPDMVTFTNNGKKVLVANEGEPDNYCTGNNDPEGSISIIDLKKGVTKAKVTTADFNSFDSQIDDLRDEGIRIFGPDATVSQDLEPEYIAVLDNKKAMISLQENNAFAILDIKKGKITDLVPLGTKDHSLLGNQLDASDKDGVINIANWPVKGMYQPDSITSYKTDGERFVVSANEGDAREYDCFLGGVDEEAEDSDIADITLDPTVFPNAAVLQDDANLGRLGVSLVEGDTDNDGDFDELFSFGTRSFSIWNSDGQQVFDSGDALEQITAAALPDNFNANNDDNEFEDRSDNKGPEPEGVVVGKIKGEHYAFIGLERVGGIVVYNVSDPEEPEFVQYINNRDFTVDVETSEAGDLGPEGLVFIKKSDSPIKEPLLVVTNEVSGTTTIYQIDKIKSDN